MSTVRRWALWRRVQYGIGFLLFFIICLSAAYKFWFVTPATCFDQMQNGTETGLDCGGGCVRLCAAEVIPPKILWAESFEILPGQYNAVAYIENANVLASAPTLAYTFKLFSGDSVVAERSGTTILPPNNVYPIFEGRVYTNNQPVTKTELSLQAVDLWLPAEVGREQFVTSNIRLLSADTNPRLEATITNTALTKAEAVEVVATLFNDLGQPVTASQTYLEVLESRAAKDIVFTWPQAITKTVRSCVIPTDIVVGIDLSGSMNNDGGTPPQPISDTVLAAQAFVSGFKPSDQASIITFASNAIVQRPLNRNHSETATLVSKLTIAPEEELGYTNTVALLNEAATELASTRHNEDARRVLVLLTDGLPTDKDNARNMVAETQAAAKALREAGVFVYAIGLGQKVDQAFISSLVSEPKAAFIAPSTGDLDSIYAAITTSLCESGATRIDILPKTKANFAPLR